MARARPDPWDAEQVKNVKGLLTTFCGDRETVCAVMDCARGDLDWLCRQAFGLTFAKAVEKFELVGKARIKSALFQAAEGGNAKALDIMCREHLDILGPVERRHKIAREVRQAEEETDF